MGRAVGRSHSYGDECMRIGIDLGGTKIEILVLAPDGTERHRERIPTPGSYPACLEALAGLVGRAEAAIGTPATVGLGIPGVTEPETGLVKNANSQWLIGRPLHADLEQRLERPVRIMNDANCFAISEAADGAGAGAQSVFGVILGTGVGGGIVIEGRPLEGANLIAGEWGHTPLPWLTADEFPGPECGCGKRGCIEAFLAGPAFERAWEARHGAGRSSREIVAAAERGEQDAVNALERYADQLGRALAGVTNLLDPEVIVLGGGMSNIPGLADRARPSFVAHVFSDIVRTRIVRNRHGDSSGVRGAAWLWPAGATG